jgi:DNA helicase HerA-like ATPase
MWDQELKDTCKKLKPLIGARADALWAAYVSADTPDSKREAEALIQMFGLRYLNTSVDRAGILLPPPTPAAAAGEFVLGNVLYDGKPLFPLYLQRENFSKHLGLFGITGSGKSNLAQVLLLGLLNRDIPFMVVDWKRSYRSLLSLDVPRVKEIRFLSVGRKSGSALNWNPLRGPPGVHPKTWISVLVEALEKSHISGPGVADILIDILDKKFDEAGFYDGTQDKYPNFFDAVEELNRVQFKGRRMLWQDSCARILKTFTFGPAAGAFNARHPMHLEDLLDKPVVIELDQELPKPLRVFLTDILLRWIHLYRLGQGETDELRHVLFLEEVHNLFPRSLIEKQTSNSLENVFREIRGFGEGLVSITQHPSLIPIYVLGNCNTQVYLGLQHEEDIFTAKRALFLENRDEVYLDRLRVGEGIVKIKGRVDPCHVRFPLVPIRKGVVLDDFQPPGGEDHRETGVD